MKIENFSLLTLIKMLYFATIFLAIMTFYSIVFIDNYVWILFLIGMVACDILKDLLEDKK